MSASGAKTDRELRTDARAVVRPESVPARHRALAGAIQRNCDRADAAHAQQMTMCIYLLNMREQYRWENDLPIAAPLDRRDVGRWIAAREAYWERLHEDGDHALEPLPVGDGAEPFAERCVNDLLCDTGLTYAAGIARFGAPVFVLAEQLSESRRDGARVRVLGRELARGLNPPIAASNANGVLIRRDAMQRWLATRVELAENRSIDDAFARVWAHYDDGGPRHDTLERLIDGELETLILHELGEMRAESLLGEGWAQMLAAVEDVRVELALRAVRDLLADCLVTIPVLHERGARGSLHFWFSTFEGMRRALAPEFAVAYREWSGADTQALDQLARLGGERWLMLGRACLTAWRNGGQAALAALLLPMVAKGHDHAGG